MPCNDGKHFISPENKKKAFDGYIVKCSKCDNYIRYVKEYHDSYFVRDMGKMREMGFEPMNR